ncbi:MAG: Card1-like endonuclease domain-containing protein [bacterium]
MIDKYKNLLITLISDQAIPNILFADYYQVKDNFILFVTTEKMIKDRKVEYILKALQLISQEGNFLEGQNYSIIKVNENSIKDLFIQVEDWLKDKNNIAILNNLEKIIVNVTSGTKLMSIGLYNFFADIIENINEKFNINIKNLEIIYLPVGENKILKLLENGKFIENMFEIKRRIRVSESCNAYGLEIINQDKLNKKADIAMKDKEISKFIIENYYGKFEHFLSFLYKEFFTKDSQTDKSIFDKYNSIKNNNNKHKNKNLIVEKKFIDFSMTYNINKHDKDNSLTDAEILVKLIIDLFNFDKFKIKGSKYINIDAEYNENDGHKNKLIISGKLSLQDVEFLRGGWFEEFCFNEINDLKKDGLIDDVILNAEIKSFDTNANNEFDILFTAQNNFYIAECKSLSQENDKQTDILYKISALRQEFGLTITSFLVSLAKDNILDKSKKDSVCIKESLQDRAKQLKCKIINPDDITNLKTVLKNFLNTQANNI